MVILGLPRSIRLVIYIRPTWMGQAIGMGHICFSWNVTLVRNDTHQTLDPPI